MAFLPFVAMPFVLRQLPTGASDTMMPWGEALVHATFLAALMVAHTICYERWHPRDPARIMLNEALARAWFVLYGFLIVGNLGPNGAWYLGLAAPWAALTWIVHLDQVRKEGYRWPTGLAVLGLFLLGLALLGLVVTPPPASLGL